MLRGGGGAAGWRPSLRRGQCGNRREHHHEQRTADALPHVGASPEGTNEECQAGSTRSATTRTASPTTWRNPPETSKRSPPPPPATRDRKSTRLNSSHSQIS